MKKSIILAIGLLISSLTLCVTASASLIGDTIHLEHQYPNQGDIGYYFGDVLVTAGTADQVSLIIGSNLYDLNPEANSVLINFHSSANFFTPAAFNGLVITNIDELVLSVTVATNLVGWSAARLSFTGSSISSNWQGLNFAEGNFFNLTINQASVPDSGSILGLFGCALAGLAVIRRKLSAA